MGECHYQVGNYDAIVTACATKKILIRAGINPERFVLDWASAAEATLYVELITNFTNQIKALGSLGQDEGMTLEEVRVNLFVARAAVKSIRLRTQIAKLVQDMRKDNDYSTPAVEAKMSEKLNVAIIREMEKLEKGMEESGVHGAE